MTTGTLQHFDKCAGSGVITPDLTDQEQFASQTELTNMPWSAASQRVRYDLVLDGRTGRARATNIRPINGRTMDGVI